MKKILLAVNGTLMRGLELNKNLIDIGAEFVREDFTSNHYRLWTIGNRYPAMQRSNDNSATTKIAVEIWDVPSEAVCQILTNEPAGLTIGKVALADGQTVLGVLGEAYICEENTEITQWGGWRAYINSLSAE